MKPMIKVAAAIIENEDNEILCALRSTQMSVPNSWEFPGGKVEAQETIAETVEREVREELGCRVRFIEIFNDTTYEYDSFIVNLITANCELIKGTPIASEHSKLLWLKRENLSSINWAPADIPAIRQLMSEKV